MRPWVGGVAAVLLAALPAGATVLERVTLAPGGIALQLSSPLAVEAHAIGGAGDAVARVFVDLPGTTLARGVPRTIDGRSPILRVRVAQRDAETVRVVLDLDRAVAPAVETEAERITLRVGDDTPPPSLGTADTPAASEAHAERRTTDDPQVHPPRRFLYDPRDFDLPKPPDDPLPAELPKGHPPVLRW
jgi:hypothetical protein